MKSNFQKVIDFCRCSGHPVYDVMQLDIFDRSPDRVKLRLALILEENKELRDAVKDSNFTEVIDALTDILYVAYGAGAEFGIDLDLTFDCVHKLRISQHFKYNNDTVDYSTLTNYQKILEFNKSAFFSFFDHEQKDILTSNPKLVVGQLKLIQDQVTQLENSIKNKNFISVLISLTSILYAVYETGIEFGINLDKMFDIVHNSNMTKFCRDETEAADTVKWYKKQFEENKLKYKSPAYKKSADGKHWVVYDKDTDKTLKSINYTPAKFN